MKLDATLEAPPPVGRTGRFVRAAAGVVLCALLSITGLFIGHRLAREAIVDVGPTDAAYVQQFRDLERDGDAYFRWSSSPQSAVTLPVRFCGPGALRMRIRRHFEDPALLTVLLDGVVVGTRSVRARSDTPYEVAIFQVPRVICGSTSLVVLETVVTNGRPLGVAVDWVSIVSARGFLPDEGTLARGAATGALLAFVLTCLGAGIRLTLATGAASAGLLGALSSLHPVAAVRLVEGGLPALALCIVGGFAIGRLPGLRDLGSSTRLAVAGIAFATLLARLAFLHPAAFYPDYRVHALVEETLVRGGLSGFLANLFTIQYARSLGLQEIAGRWYPFPYPPGSYVLIALVAKVFGLRALDACLATAAAAAALLPVLAVAIARSLGVTTRLALWGAGALTLHPLFVRRMALGYFPGVIGETIDAAILAVILCYLSRDPRPRWGLIGLTGLLVGGFLVYTQSIANFGLLLLTLFALEILRASGRWARLIPLAASALLALGISFAVFYSAYLPVARNIRAGLAQPESVVLDRLEKVRAQAQPADRLATDDGEADPFSGPGISPLRAAGRLAARLWRFNGPFVVLLPPGLWLVWQGMRRENQNAVLACLGVSLWITLLAAGLPSPNGFQHLKDLEFATPILSLALAAAHRRIAESSRAAGWALAVIWVAYTTGVAVAEFSARLLPLAER